MDFPGAGFLDLLIGTKKMEKLKFETFTCACVSMAHITRADSELLEAETHAGVCDLIVQDYEYGFWVYVPTEPSADPNSLKKYSVAFNELLRIARQKSWRYLQIDRDGTEVEGLPKFDW